MIMPAGTFYVFPNVAPICMRLGITSHGLAMYLLEAADDAKGVACLGGECFGPAGKGFLRFSCAEPDERLKEAVAFLKEAVKRVERAWPAKDLAFADVAAIQECRGASRQNPKSALRIRRAAVNNT